MRLILLPNLLSPDQKEEQIFSKEVKDKVLSLQGLVAESEKGARLFLLRFLPREKIDMPILLLNEHTKNIDPIIEEMQGKRWGLISDAGLPSLADPGADLVYALRRKKIPIEAVGIFCSITKALILSGLGGQKFSFQGYLPRKKPELHKELHYLFHHSMKRKTTQICIEAPYRSGSLFSEIVKIAPASLLLSVAQDLSSKDERVETYSIQEWKKYSIKPKSPSVFLFRQNFSRN